MSISVEHFLVVGAVLFGIGLWTALSKRNAIQILMGIEIMLNAVNLTLVAFARFVKSPAGLQIGGQVFVIFILTVAAAEASVALAMVVSVYRNRGTVDIDKID